MPYQEIDDPRKWRVSMSGYSIKTGWGDEKRIVAKFPGAYPGTPAELERWMDEATLICDLYNATLPQQ